MSLPLDIVNSPFSYCSVKSFSRARPLMLLHVLVRPLSFSVLIDVDSKFPLFSNPVCSAAINGLSCQHDGVASTVLSGLASDLALSHVDIESMGSVGGTTLSASLCRNKREGFVLIVLPNCCHQNYDNGASCSLLYDGDGLFTKSTIIGQAIRWLFVPKV
jgi:hypothetical protein